KEGLDWIDDADLRTVLLRHYPDLGRTGLANIRNAFEPWDNEERLDPARHPLGPDPWVGERRRNNLETVQRRCPPSGDYRSDSSGCWCAGMGLDGRNIGGFICRVIVARPHAYLLNLGLLLGSRVTPSRAMLKGSGAAPFSTSVSTPPVR